MTFQSPDEPNSIEEDVRRQFNKSEEKEAPEENLPAAQKKAKTCFSLVSTQSSRDVDFLLILTTGRVIEKKKERKKQNKNKVVNYIFPTFRFATLTFNRAAGYKRKMNTDTDIGQI